MPSLNLLSHKKQPNDQRLSRRPTEGKPVGSSYGRWGGRPPHRRSRTGRESFPSSSSSVHEPLSQARHWKRLLAPGAWQLHVWRWTFRPVLSPEWAKAHPACLRLSLLLHRCLLVYRPHVSISPALPRAFASWGILLRPGFQPGRPLPYPGEHRTGFPVPDVHFAWL